MNIDKTTQKIVKNISRVFLMLIFFFITPYLLFAKDLEKSQVTDNVSIELDAVQTKAGTFLAAVMITDKKEDILNCQIRDYRSTNYGKSWDSVYSVDKDSSYQRNADPFMTIDSEGNIYIVLMRIKTISENIANLWVYKSNDDGLNWSIAGKPVNGVNFADYPQIIAGDNGKLFVSYTEYKPSPFTINMTKSDDYGISWHDSKTIKPGITGYSSVGADMAWLKDNIICIAFGDYGANTTYLTSSKDFGETWLPCTALPTISYSVNKIVCSREFEHFGVITHNPHKSNSVVYFNYTLDGGYSWSNKIIDHSSAYCEGLIDKYGNYHIVYNNFENGKFNLTYVYSTDNGLNFSNPVKLISSSYNGSINKGEYQSLIMGKDNQLYITYIDWSELSKVSQIVFPPMLINSVSQSESNSIKIYPNPAEDFFMLNNTISGETYTIEIYNFEGQLVQQNSYNINGNKVNIKNLTTGSYLVLIKSHNQTFIEKLVKK
jgi:hypothetical protein